MVEYILTFFMLVALQAVLGFDNLLYISLESKRAPLEKQSMVRKWGIGIAIILRIVLLFTVVSVIKAFQEPLLVLDNFMVSGSFNIQALVEIAGGIFIIYTATKEIIHSLTPSEVKVEGGNKSTVKVIVMITLMNLVFSFDSILSAIVLTDSFVVMSLAIIASGIMMMWLSDVVSNFLSKNRIYEILGLFILFIVGIMLCSEGAHIGGMHLFGYEVTAMSKATFYFVIVILVLIDIIQGQYEKILKKNQ